MVDNRPKQQFEFFRAVFRKPGCGLRQCGCGGHWLVSPCPADPGSLWFTLALFSKLYGAQGMADNPIISADPWLRCSVLTTFGRNDAAWSTLAKLGRGLV